jgi:hypothetical protein
MGLPRGVERGEIYQDRAKYLLELKRKRNFGKKFLKKWLDLECFFKKLGFSTVSL